MLPHLNEPFLPLPAFGEPDDAPAPKTTTPLSIPLSIYERDLASAHAAHKVEVEDLWAAINSLVTTCDTLFEQVKMQDAKIAKLEALRPKKPTPRADPAEDVFGIFKRMNENPFTLHTGRTGVSGGSFLDDNSFMQYPLSPGPAPYSTSEKKLRQAYDDKKEN